MNTQAEKTLPLDDVMLAMDVVDTLRHRQDLVTRELNEAGREEQLIGKLRDIYREQGIEVPEHILKEGVAALAESRFVYTPPAGGFGVMLARLYVSRGKWGRWFAGVVIAAIVALCAYQFAYLPMQRAQVEAARVELAETLPAQMDMLYNAIYQETKVQTAVEQAGQARSRGRIAAREGDRDGALAAIDTLTEIRDTIRADFTLRVVNRENMQSGFWTFPEINTEATNYYIVVEALDADGNALELPIVNEETGETENVTAWGLRVPEQVYRAVEADKRDDGIIQRNVVGRKEYGYLEINYAVPVLGGAVTRW